MNQKTDDVFEVMLKRDELLNYPDYALPPGYTFRLYKAGDYEAWVRIHLEAEPFHSVDLPLFFKEFGNDENILGKRQYFACNPEGREVGTATAWFNNELLGENYGRIHWVAVSPVHQGKGLAKALTTRVCHRFVELGHSKALVTTENFRTNAIHIYLKFGFMPCPRNETEKQFWQNFR